MDGISEKSSKFMNIKFLLVTFSALSSLLFFADDTYAWGAGLHIKEGVFMLDNLKLILPHIASVLKAFPYDYLSHLAADVIAHNFYIPNQLYLTSSTKRFGHIYWEFRSDEYIEKRYWKIAKMVINRHNHHNDEFMQDIIKRKLITFRTKKQIYSHSINVNDIALWQKAVAMVSRSSRWDVKKKDIDFLNRVSINMIISLLKNPNSSLCFNYDPVGTDNLLSSKRKRRINIVLNGRYPVEKIFKRVSPVKHYINPPLPL